MKRARPKKLYTVIAQQVCKTRRRGSRGKWTSSVGLPMVEVMARSKAQAITRAKKIWRGRGVFNKSCKLHPSAEEQ